VPMQQLDHLLELCLGTGTFFLLVGHSRFRMRRDCRNMRRNSR
jgi:hypothetical protein